MKFVDVVVPVYGGLEETKECILSALDTIDPKVGQLIVINDCSPEPELVAWLIQAAEQHKFQLLHNEQNLGFVATVNRGMMLNVEHDVLLLNSDVEVAGDWLSRLREGAYQNTKTASITPFSNNATICSFPNFCCDNELLFGLDVKALGQHFSKTFDSSDLISIPTAIGFCMYIRRDCLEQVGYFDVETFGRGYGEENDWCQRAQKAGWGNYHQMNVFAYHKGGVSFSDSQEPRKANAMRLLSQLHPDYDRQVQEFILRDPAKGYRLRALVKLLAQLPLPKVLQVSHKLGGGVQQHIDELDRCYGGVDAAASAVFLQLKPEVNGRSVSLSIMSAGESLLDGLGFCVETQYDALLKFLESVGIGRVHYHHTMGLHPRIWGLSRDLECGYDLTVHDYYAINGNPTLTDAEARFADGLSESEIDRACAEAYPISVNAETWRGNHRSLIESAERVIFPSLDTYQRFSQYFTLSNSVVAWHSDHKLAQPYPKVSFAKSSKQPLKVLVLGALSREKGADLLESVAKKLASSEREAKECEFHLLGYAYRPLHSSVTTHGPYDGLRVKQLIEELEPDVVWYPAQWPETYSYTLSSALQMGLPVVVPNIGAFRERVEARDYSWVLPWNSSRAQWVEFWRSLSGSGVEAVVDYLAKGDEASSRVVQDFYDEEYLAVAEVRTSDGEAFDEFSLSHFSQSCSAELTVADKVLRIVWRVSRLPLVSYFVKLIPFEFKREFKRRLSARAMHEILNTDRP